MQYIYEAVITPHGEGFQASFPGWDGLTAEGEDFADVARNATAALQQAANDALEKRQALPECAFDAEVPEGGRSIIISIDALPSSVSLLLTARDASAVLGVTRSRISNMLRAGILEQGHRDGRSTVITLRSVNNRLANPRKPGRPKKLNGEEDDDE